MGRGCWVAVAGVEVELAQGRPSSRHTCAGRGGAGAQQARIQHSGPHCRRLASPCLQGRISLEAQWLPAFTT